MTTRQRKINDRDLWLNEWRPGNINASEAGALFAIDPKVSPLTLYHRKLGTIGPEEDNDAMRRGRWLEPGVIKATQELRPDLSIWQPETYFDDPELRIGCTPDAFATDRIGRKGVVQAKTVGENVYEKWCESGNLETPLTYQLQTMVEAVQTKRTDFALLSIMIMGYGVVGLKILEIPVLQETWDAYLVRVKRFWANFEKGIAPPVTGADGDLIKKLYPGEPGAMIDLTGNNRIPELLERYYELSVKLKEVRAPEKPLEKEYKGVRTEIAGIMGDAEFALLPGGKIATLKEQTNPGWRTRVLYIKDLKG
jgi:predicted phage-related endonuclease